jgi:DNA ligase D
VAASALELDVDGRAVRITSPDKVLFAARGETKLDLVGYALAVGEGLLRGLHDRPTTLHRFPHGPDGEGFFQKRVVKAPAWIPTVHVAFPAGGSADELCPTHLSHLVWAMNLGCMEFHPWAVRRADLMRPDELRVDLDPAPGVPFDAVRSVARTVREVLSEVGMEGHPKTSGSRGLHVYVRVEPRWGYLPLRRCVLALAREVERRMPAVATTAWWKEDRGERVFLDFNQNLPDKTVVSAYSVRPTAEATVSCPLTWEEVDDADPRDLTIATVPARVAEVGDLMAGIDVQASSLEPLLEWVERDEAEGIGEAPFPPHFPKVPGEPPRVQPSRARERPDP